MIGYDNKHGHHRHCKGNIELVDTADFAEIERRFAFEWALALEEFNARSKR